MDKQYPSLPEQLDGARYVRYDGRGTVYAWFGGHGIHGYKAHGENAGQEVNYWNIGDFAEDEASFREVKKEIDGRVQD